MSVSIASVSAAEGVVGNLVREGRRVMLIGK